MMRAGLSGCVSTNAPGYMTANVADGTLSGRGPGSTTVSPSSSTEPRPIDTSIWLAPSSPPRSTTRPTSATSSSGSTRSPTAATPIIRRNRRHVVRVRHVRRRWRRLPRPAQLIAPRGAGRVGSACRSPSASWPWRSASALGVPIRGVGLPGHFVIRDEESGPFARSVRRRYAATTRRG